MGCEAVDTHGMNCGALRGVSNKGSINLSFTLRRKIVADNCTPIMREFSEMTEDEVAKYWSINTDGYSTVGRADYLDSIAVDQRGWLEKRIARKKGGNDE
jgi:hypothetical protein